MRTHCLTRLTLAICALSISTAALSAEPQQTEWGTIIPLEQGRFRLLVTAVPESRVIALPTPFAPIVAAATESSPSVPLKFEFNADASKLVLQLPEEFENESSIALQTADVSGQFDDGRIVFSAIDAQVTGSSAKLESHPGNHRIGFWTNADDFAEWNFKATRWGMYRILLTYSCAGPNGTEVEVEVSDKPDQPLKRQATLTSTGSWYRYTTLNLGTLYLSAAGPQKLTVRCLKKAGGAVMNLKSVLLIPACEGTPPEQAEDGSITLHARDATIHGTMLRWEPAEAKQTLGYWVRPSDFASWEVTVKQPGTFVVDVWQGCGTGQGGSTMRIGTASQSIQWTVEETGHFQNFKQRTIGQLTFKEPGTFIVTAKVSKLANKAACDIRQIQLRPVATAN